MDLRFPAETPEQSQRLGFAIEGSPTHFFLNCLHRNKCSPLAKVCVRTPLPPDLWLRAWPMNYTPTLLQSGAPMTWWDTGDRRGNHDSPRWYSTLHCGIANLGNDRASWVHPYFKMDKGCPFNFLGVGFHFKPFESLFCWRALDDFERNYFQYSGAGHGMPMCSQPSASSLVAIPFSVLNLEMFMGVYICLPYYHICLTFFKISLSWIYMYMWWYMFIYIHTCFRWIILHVFLMAWVPITVDSTLPSRIRQVASTSDSRSSCSCRASGPQWFKTDGQEMESYIYIHIYNHIYNYIINMEPIKKKESNCIQLNPELFRTKTICNFSQVSVFFSIPEAVQRHAPCRVTWSRAGRPGRPGGAHFLSSWKAIQLTKMAFCQISIYLGVSKNREKNQNGWWK